MYQWLFYLYCKSMAQAGQTAVTEEVFRGEFNSLLLQNQIPIEKISDLEIKDLVEQKIHHQVSLIKMRDQR